MIDPRVYIVAGAVAVGAAGGWLVNGWRLGSELAGLQAAHNGLIAAANATTLAAVKAEQDRYKTREQERNNIDAGKTAELAKAQHELQTLRTGVADGSIGLRVAATCPRSTGDVPARSSGPGVDDGAAPELTADAQQAYYSLLENIATMTKQLEGLQELERLRQSK